MIDEKKRRGRPPTGQAKTAAERGKEFDAALKESGGRILGRVRLSAEAAKALSDLSAQHGSERAAIEYSLIGAANSHRKKLR